MSDSVRKGYVLMVATNGEEMEIPAEGVEAYSARGFTLSVPASSSTGGVSSDSVSAKGKDSTPTSKS